MNILDVTLEDFLVFGMALIRMSGLVVFMPFFGSDYFPRTARAGFVVFLALVVFPRAAQTIPEDFRMDLFELAALACREAVIGLVMGQVASFFFSGLQLGGELIGQQIGFSLANIIDPMYDTQVGLISFVYFLVAMGVFVGLDLHLVLLQILALSYEFVGVGEAVFTPELLQKISALFGDIWVVAMQTGGPILAIMMLVSVIQGFISRTMPQFNIIAIGLPMQTVIGLTALMLGLEAYCQTVAMLSERLLTDLNTLVELLGPAEAK